MSKVTYIWGAGASYGERKKDEHGQIIGFTRGLPVVNEFARALHLLQTGEEQGTGVRFPHGEAEKRGVTLSQYENVNHKLSQLEKACTSFPTIDTLAKQLYVTGGKFWTSEKEFIDYNDLKRYISTALLMMQSEEKRDLRYDGLIASLINQNRELPSMTILSWNYDVQFEMAYSGYNIRGRYIPTLWEELNVFNKMYPTEFNANKPFAMIKLNGTALFTDNTLEAWQVGTKGVNRITDCFYGGAKEKPFQYGFNYLTGGNYHNMLSYAWEEKNQVALDNAIEKRVYDTEELIVIGYSFPYVNNKMDSFILESMPRLKKVIVQDLDDKFEDVKERIEAILEGGNKKIEIIHKRNLQQFYIPNDFGKK